METTIQSTLIEKELISGLSFSNPQKIKQHPDLMNQIKHATRLGNGYHSKVKIYFIDDKGSKSVHTTIWAYGSKYICLKGGVWIPIDHIVEIKS